MKSSVNFIDITGNKYGRLTVLSRDNTTVKVVYWFCKCSCGNEKRIRGTHLRAGKIQSCGCMMHDLSKKFIDLTGKKFHYIKVIKSHSIGERSMWEVVCKCGKNFITDGQRLRSGKTKSCGCYATEIRTKHGVTIDHKKLYNVWIGMKSRCYNPKNDHYKYYGGRGIKINKIWLDDNTKFFDWALRSGYKIGLSIDRTNNDGDYGPRNCRWATNKEQMQNTSKCIGDKIALKVKNGIRNGEKMKLLAAKYNISYDSVIDIKYGRIYSHVLCQ